MDEAGVTCVLGDSGSCYLEVLADAVLVIPREDFARVCQNDCRCGETRHHKQGKFCVACRFRWGRRHGFAGGIIKYRKVETKILLSINKRQDVVWGRGWDLNPGARLHRPIGYQATSPRPLRVFFIYFLARILSCSFGT